MLKFLPIIALVATACAQHHGADHGHAQSHGSSDDAHAEITHYDADVHEHGFHYGFETTNHIKAFSEGDEHGNVHGNFEWISPEGAHIGVSYDANENGYQPRGDVLPTPHPIPDAILRSLEYIASHPHEEVAAVHHGHRV